MKSIGQYVTRLVRLKWILIGVGLAAFAGFGVTGGVLADAGWNRIGNLMLGLAIFGWVVAACGVCLYVYDFIRQTAA